MNNISCVKSLQVKQTLVFRLKQASLHLLKRCAQQIDHWERCSHNRQMMAQMDDHLRKDVGLSQSEWKHEIAKPFWRD